LEGSAFLSTPFYNNEAVAFDGTGSATPAVNLVATAYVPSVAVSGSSSYTVSGAGSLVAAGSLTQDGTGNFTVGVPATLGGLVLNNGAVTLTKSNYLAGGPITIGPNTATPVNLTIANGGSLLAFPTGGSFNLTADGNQLTVADAGSTLDLRGLGGLHIGNVVAAVSNVVTLRDGGAWINIPNNLVIPNGTGANHNQLIVTNGGRLEWDPAAPGNLLVGHSLESYNNSVVVVGASSVLNLRGKSLYAGRQGTNNTVLFDAGLGTNIGGINIGDNNVSDGSKVTVQNGARVHVAGAISFTANTNAVNSAFVMTDASSRVEAADLNMTRPSTAFTLNGGALKLNAANVNNGLSFTVGNGAQTASLELGGGTVNGTLAPGTSVGTITGANTVALNGSTVMELDRGNAQNADLLAADTLTLGGSLVVTNIGAPLQGGDSFQLFSSPNAFGGTFGANVTLPVLGCGLTWDTSALETSGVISVAGGSAAPTLGYTNVAPDVIQFNWTGAYKLVWQTNALSVGLQPNWVDYPGGGTSPVSVTNNKSIPTAFFGLQPTP
jgi:hypothetical protein